MLERADVRRRSPPFEAGATLRFGARIRAISKSGVDGSWEVTAFGDQAATRFDQVIFGGSVAEVFTTFGDFAVYVAPHQRQLQAGNVVAAGGVRHGGEFGGGAVSGRGAKGRRVEQEDGGHQ